MDDIYIGVLLVCLLFLFSATHTHTQKAFIVNTFRSHFESKQQKLLKTKIVLAHPGLEAQ